MEAAAGLLGSSAISRVARQRAVDARSCFGRRVVAFGDACINTRCANVLPNECWNGAIRLLLHRSAVCACQRHGVVDGKRSALDGGLPSETPAPSGRTISGATWKWRARKLAVHRSPGMHGAKRSLIEPNGKHSGARAAQEPIVPRSPPLSCGRRSGLKAVTWLILPVVICLSQRLSHACLSINCLYCETANGSLNQL